MRVRIAPGTQAYETAAKILAIFYCGIFLIHLVRDVLQDNGVKILLSTILVKQPAYPQISSVLWKIFNTYAIAAVEIALAIICLKKNSFGKIGRLTVIIAVVALSVWLVYWLFL